MRFALPLAALALVAAAPAMDPLQSRLVAEAGAVQPAALAFTRKVTATQTDGTKTETKLRVDRWDGKQWTLVSEDGKPPSAEAAASFRKEAAGRPVGGYYRLAHFLAKPAVRGTDAQGNTVFKIAKLPPGSVDISGDRSDKFVGEATVSGSGPDSYIRRLHLYAPAPFRLMIIARIDRYDIVNEYAPGRSGRPELVRQVQQYSGSRPGESGTVRTETVYSYTD